MRSGRCGAGPPVTGLQRKELTLTGVESIKIGAPNWSRSRGIGTALVATAIGIATALLGLLGNNVISRRAQVLTEDFKALLLSLTP